MQTTTRPKHNIRENFLPYALPTIGEEEIAEVVDSRCALAGSLPALRRSVSN